MRAALWSALFAACGSAAAATPARMPTLPVPHQPLQCAEDAGWDDPMPTRHLFGDVWYVGTCGITSILIASPQGHVLIDGGAKLGAQRIVKNLRALGVDLKDIKYILVSHEHFDHVGGVAQLQRDSGAVVLTRQEAAASLKRGKSDRRDPQFDVLDPFPAIANVQSIKAGAGLRAAGRTIINVPMPGHTPGGSGWRWRECEGSVCLNFFYSDSVSAISDKTYRYSDAGALARPMQQTLSRLEKAPCDVLMTTHPSSSHLIERLEGKEALVQPQACRKLAESAKTALKLRLSQEASKTAP